MIKAENVQATDNHGLQRHLIPMDMDDEPELPHVQSTQDEMSRFRATAVISVTSSMVLMNSVLSGILTVGLSRIARDVGLDDNILLWPACVYGLTCGCTVVLSGALSDVVGNKFMYLVGCVLLVAFTLGCGLAKSGIQLILFRAFSGIAMSCCLPSSISILTSIFHGSRRNIALACLGAAQPVGFAVGLVLGGLLIQTVGWRYGYFIVAGVIFGVFLLALYGIPVDARRSTNPFAWRKLRTDIDWIGVTLMSFSLAVLSYILAVMTMGIRQVLRPVNLTLLAAAALTVPTFIWWSIRQEKLQRTVLIPPSLFKSGPDQPNRGRVFAVTCLSVFLTWAVFNVWQYFTALYFERIQHLSTLEASIRFIPMVVSGALANIVTGLLVNRVSANILCITTAVASGIAPLLMAFASPSWPYWAAGFIGATFIPIAADTLFTVSNLVITTIFPKTSHGLAGGVFNTISQIGMSFGLAITAVIAAALTSAQEAKSYRSHTPGMEGTDALLRGYQAAYWTTFGVSILLIALNWWGLRNMGKVGAKID